MQTPPTHERLVARLIADAQPVRPLWSPRTRLALWLALQTLSLGVAVEFGLRRDLGDHLRQPLFLLEVGALVVAGAMAAAVALRGAVPGTGSGRPAVAVSLLLGSAAVGLVSLEPGVTIRSLWGLLASGAQCVGCILRDPPPPSRSARPQALPLAPLLRRRPQVVHPQPQAPRMAEERERDDHAERHPDRELLRERQPNGPVEHEHDAHRDRDRHRVVDVDGADEEPLLALVAEPAGHAPLVHAEVARVER